MSLKSIQSLQIFGFGTVLQALAAWTVSFSYSTQDVHCLPCTSSPGNSSDSKLGDLEDSHHLFLSLRDHCSLLTVTQILATIPVFPFWPEVEVIHLVLSRIILHPSFQPSPSLTPWDWVRSPSSVFRMIILATYQHSTHLPASLLHFLTLSFPIRFYFFGGRECLLSLDF